MADNAFGSCSDRSLTDTSGNCLPERRSKKKFCGYHYVPSESDEADTLKDKFWRDLEQGKLNFLNTVDMYTRVKQPGKLTEVDSVAVSYQDRVSPSDTAPVTCSQPSMPLSSVTSARDASPPSSSGYESSSIPSIGSLSVTDSPTESDLHVGSLCDFFTNVAQSNTSVLKRKKKRTNKCIWESSFRSRCRKRQTAPRTASKRKKTTNSKFFRYVDAASDEADTLKDKFWRDLEMGNVTAITTSDLYSSVKVSRRARQFLLFSVRNSDHVRDLIEVAGISSKCSQANQSSDYTKVLNDGVKCCEADDSSYNRKHDLGTLDESSDCYISDHVASVADCKLLSPCSVSVERLSFSIDNVDMLVAETCSSIVAGNFNCIKAETDSNSIKKRPSFVSSGMSVNVDCKQYWNRGRYRTGLRHFNKGVHTLRCISGSNTRVECVHFSSLEINRSLPVCQVPLAFPPTWQQHFLCSWLDDAVAKAGSLRDSVMNGDMQSVRQLLTAETNPVPSKECQPNNMTLVMLAARHGMASVIQLLVESGYDVNVQRPDGITALMIACRMGWVTVVSVLLDCGAKTELCTNSGETALMKAVRSGSLDIVALLLSRGANFAITSHAGVTAATLARRAQRSDIFLVVSSHIRRLSRAFTDQINEVIGCFADVQFALFPLQCFPLSNFRQFSVTFGTKWLSQGGRALLFIGHALVGCHSATCRLDGDCAVTDAFLNDMKLQRLSANGNFIMSFEHLRDGQNELVLHVDSDPLSKVVLLVCAYYISCKTDFMTTD